MSEEREELAAARLRIAQLEREAEANRLFLERAVEDTKGVPPPRAPGPTLGHGAALLLGVVVGVLLTVAGVVARRPEPQLPFEAPVPPRPAPGPRGEPAWPRDEPKVAQPVARADAGPPDARASPEPVARARAARADDSGSLNLTATSGAEVFVDGRRLGLAPRLGVEVAPGEHLVRFVCASGAPEAVEQRVTVPAFAEVDVEHRCE